MKKQITAFLTGIAITTSCHAFDLTGTYFYFSGKKHDIDPTLLYSIALAESAKREGSNVAPYPFALRTDKPFYPESKIEAAEKLRQILDSGNSLVDVGLMQVNVYWQRHIIDDPLRLLDVEYNIDKAAQVLSKNIQLSKGNIPLAVGRYNSWTEIKRAEAYSQKVMTIYNNLKLLESNNKG